MYPGWYTRTYTREVYTHQGASSHTQGGVYPPGCLFYTPSYHTRGYPPLYTLSLPYRIPTVVHTPLYHSGYTPLYTPSLTPGIHRCTHPLSHPGYTPLYTLSHPGYTPLYTSLQHPGIP